MLATGLRQHLAQGALRSTSSLLRKPLVVLPRSLSTSAQSKEAAAASSEAAQEQEAPATAAAEQKAPQVPKTPNYIEKQKKAEEYSARQEEHLRQVLTKLRNTSGSMAGASMVDPISQPMRRPGQSNDAMDRVNAAMEYKRRRQMATEEERKAAEAEAEARAAEEEAKKDGKWFSKWFS